ncbi:amino acid permease [Shimazuella kribbensis]|uniref:amino acid permease n=1 Tax=Shimazuella kribbensis TaxID=139808 RepID=UPI00042090F5|nr:amino acid permease [Shimazuella kribbensis]
MGENDLRRDLSSRHISMLAIGGSIGTGLFLASGTAIHQAGAGGAILAYAVIGFMVFFLMTSLGEMASFMPVTGSFSTYASRFVDPALGFALGWNYWYNWAVTIAVELSAGALLMKFWFPTVPSYLWSLLFLFVFVVFNLISVRGFGESEFWFALIKVVAIIVFIIVGILMIFGVIGGSAVGFSNIHAGSGAFHGGYFTLFQLLIVAGFSFQGTELVGVTAGESKNPEKSLPKAVKQIFWRILLFYVLALLVIGFLIPSNDPRLLGGDEIALSPFTIVFFNLGFEGAASFVNFIVLTAVLSAGNSAIYACTRMLWNLSKEKQAPKSLGKVNRRGVPVVALLFTVLVGGLTFLSSIFGDGKVYLWLLNASGLSGFLAWLGIAISHYRFRKAWVAQGKDLNSLPYRAKWYPFGPLFAGIFCLVIIIGQNVQAFTGQQIDWQGVLVSYISIPLFLLLFFIYKWKKKTKQIPLHQVDFDNR